MINIAAFTLYPERFYFSKVVFWNIADFHIFLRIRYPYPFSVWQSPISNRNFNHCNQFYYWYWYFIFPPCQVLPLISQPAWIEYHQLYGNFDFLFLILTLYSIQNFKHMHYLNQKINFTAQSFSKVNMRWKFSSTKSHFVFHR